MNYNGENFVGTNENIIEIVSSYSGLELLKRSGNENIKVCLPLSLCIGKLDSIIPYNRDNLSQYNNTNLYDFNAEFEKLKDYINKCEKIRIWSSHLDSDDYCLLLLICYLFKEKELGVFYAEEINWATTISGLDENDIVDLEKREHILTKWQKQVFCNEWEQIVNDNKELRYMVNGSVVSCDISRFDSEIIDRLNNKGRISIYNFIADLIGNPIVPFVRLSDWIYVYLIERLEQIGIIKSNIVDGKKYIELNK